MAGVKIVDLPSLGRDLASTDLLELSLAGGTGSRKITGQEIMNTSKLNIGTTAITSGTVGRVLFEGTGNVVSESANLFWDNTNVRLGVGIATPTNTLNVYTSVANYGLRLQSNSTGANLIGTEYLWDATQLGTFSVNGASGEFKWFMKSGGFFPTIYSNGVERLRIASTGNVLINTTTDAGFKLDVNGTARFGNISQTTNANSITAGYQGGFVLTGGVGSLKQDATTYNKTLLDCGYEGGLRIRPYSVGFTSYVDVRSDTSSALTVTSTNQGFLPPRLTTTQKNAIATPATGLQVYDSTTLAPSIYNGTNWQDVLVPNSSGNVGIGTSSPAHPLQVYRNTSAGYLASFNSGATLNTNASLTVRIENANLPSLQALNAGAGAFSTFALNPLGGNILINTTTDAGYKLDVNGTARVSNMTSQYYNAGQNGSSYQVQGNNVLDVGDGLRLNYSPTYSKISLFTNSGTKGLQVNNGSVSIGPQLTPHASSILDLTSTTQGFLPPRMTQAQRNAIASPAIGLEIYQTDATEGKYIYKSSGWTYIG